MGHASDPHSRGPHRYGWQSVGPFRFNCKTDPVQHAIWKAEQRSIRFATQQGAVVVAAEGNQADDLSPPTLDATSPENTTAQLRTIHTECVVIPLELPGVIG